MEGSNMNMGSKLNMRIRLLREDCSGWVGEW